MLKWVIKLSEYEIKYQPRLVLKGQVMIDFIAELPQKPTYPVESPREQWWTLYVDRTSRVSGFGVGLILQSQTEELLEQVIHLNSSATNNEVEYEDPSWVRHCHNISCNKVGNQKRLSANCRANLERV